nr:hypothetical protein [Phyllobacterium zundukense]
MMHISESLPPLDGLNALLAAADAGSFTAAAEILGITHGSVMPASFAAAIKASRQSIGLRNGSHRFLLEYCRLA